MANGSSGYTTVSELRSCSSLLAGAWHSVSDAAIQAQCIGGGDQIADCVSDGSQWIGKQNFSPSAAGILLAGDVFEMIVSNLTISNVRSGYGIDATAM